MADKFPSASDFNINSDIPNTEKFTPTQQEYIDSINNNQKEYMEFIQQNPPLESEIPIVDWSYVGRLTDPTDPEKFNPSELANDLTIKYKVCTDLATGIIYFYDEKKGIYREDGEQILEVIIDKVLGKENRENRVKETIALLRPKTYTTINSSNKIALTNGVLNPQTGEFTEPKFTTFTTNKLTVEYKPDAVSPAWIDFIEQVCPEDKLSLQEWSGYLLLKDYPIHKIAWMLGTGRNGKGVWTRTMEAVLGQENCSSIGLEEFDGKHRFALYQLKNSLFNVSSEPRTDKILQTELVKKITGQDTIEAEIKRVQHRVKFTNHAKMTIIGNEYPKVEDNTDAFWERVLLISFPNQFKGEKQKQNLEKTWLDDPQQKSGILNWMLEGLQRLLKQGHFSTSKSQEDMIVEFKRASDPEGAFIHEIIYISTKEYTAKNTAYETYKEYCDICGIVNTDEKRFAQRIRKIPLVKEGQKKGLGRVWLGLALKELPQAKEDIEDAPTPQKTLELETPETPETPPSSTEKKNPKIINPIQDKIPVSADSGVSKNEKSGFKISQIKSITYTDEPLNWHLCGFCDNTYNTSNQAELFDGEKVWICYDCEAKFHRSLEVK